MVPAAWLSGACLAIRTDARPRFDERYFMYFEDVELCARLAAAGHRVGVCTSTVAAHATGWSHTDPLRWRRGVEFSRSAARFAEATGHRRASMRAAGLLLYGSRTLLRGRKEAEVVASRSIARGFALWGTDAGLEELAGAHNAAHGF
jgi:GT2 family glycosyltransferase